MAVAEREAATEQEQEQAAPAIHISTADGDSEPLKLPSLCMRCHETGTTTMLLVNIPHFRELLIASFECPECGFRNSEVQFAGAFGEHGVHHTLTVAKGQTDLLRRQVVKSNSATVTIPELQFEIPPGTQKGVITTVEGLLTDASTGLRELQDERRKVDAAIADAIEAVLDQLDACAAAERDFSLIVDDPAGCSHIEPGDADDGSLTLSTYERTPEQSKALGLSAGADAAGQAGDERDGSGGATAAALEQVPEGAGVENWEVHHRGAVPLGAPALQHFGGSGIRSQGDPAAAARLLSHVGSAPEEVVELPGHCFACGAECHTRMFPTVIPHFKDVIIMSNSCDVCGYRDSELKPGGGFSDKGLSITLQVRDPADLSRDVIKSDTAEVSIPELDLHITTGSLGGLITTVEGLATSVQDSFKRMHSFSLGDSAEPGQKARYTEFFARLAKFARLEEPWTVVIRDPLANSFVAPLTEDPGKDERLVVEEFERSAEDNAEYGIDHLLQNLELHDDQGGAKPAAAGFNACA